MPFDEVAVTAVPLNSYVFYRDTASPRGWSCGFVVKETVAQNNMIEIIPMRYTGTTASLLENFRNAPKKPWAHFHNSTHTFAVEGQKPTTRSLSIVATAGGVQVAARLPTTSAADSQHRPSDAASLLGESSSGPQGHRKSTAGQGGKKVGAGRSNRRQLPGTAVSEVVDTPSNEQGGKGNFIDEVEAAMCNAEAFRQVQVLEALKKHICDPKDAPQRPSMGASTTNAPRPSPRNVWQPKSYFQTIPDVLVFESATVRIPLTPSAFERLSGAASSTALEPAPPNRLKLNVFRSVILVAVPGSEVKVPLATTSSSTASQVGTRGGSSLLPSVFDKSTNRAQSFVGQPLAPGPPASAAVAPRSPAQSSDLGSAPQQQPVTTAAKHRKRSVAASEAAASASSLQLKVPITSRAMSPTSTLISIDPSSPLMSPAATAIPRLTPTPFTPASSPAPSPVGASAQVAEKSVVSSRAEGSSSTLRHRVRQLMDGSPTASSLRPQTSPPSDTVVQRSPPPGTEPASELSINTFDALVEQVSVGRQFARQNRSAAAKQGEHQRTLSSQMNASTIWQRPPPVAEYVMFDHSILDILPALLHTQHVADEAAESAPVDPSPVLRDGCLVVPRLSKQWLSFLAASRHNDGGSAIDCALVSFFPSDVDDRVMHDFSVEIATGWIALKNLSFSMVQHPFLSPTAMELSFEIKKSGHTDAARLERIDHIVAEDAVPAISKRGIADVLTAVAFRWSRSPCKAADAPWLMSNRSPYISPVNIQRDAVVRGVFADAAVSVTPAILLAPLQHVELSFLKLEDSDLCSPERNIFEAMVAALPWLTTLSFRGNFLTDKSLIALVNLWTGDVDLRVRHARVARGQRRRSKRAAERLLSFSAVNSAAGEEAKASITSSERSADTPQQPAPVAIKRLDLSLNRIGDDGAFVLADSLRDGRVAPQLTFVNLEGNAISKHIKENVVEAMVVPLLAPGWSTTRHSKCDGNVRRRVLTLALCLLTHRDRKHVIDAARWSCEFDDRRESAVVDDASDTGASQSILSPRNSLAQRPSLPFMTCSWEATAARGQRRSVVNIIEVPLPLSKSEADAAERQELHGLQNVEVDSDNDQTSQPPVVLSAVRRFSVQQLTHLAKLHGERLAEAERHREHEQRQTLISAVAQFMTMYDRQLPLSVLW